MCFARVLLRQEKRADYNTTIILLKLDSQNNKSNYRVERLSLRARHTFPGLQPRREAWLVNRRHSLPAEAAQGQQWHI
jgi:hypothetical protein